MTRVETNPSLVQGVRTALGQDRPINGAQGVAIQQAFVDLGSDWEEISPNPRRHNVVVHSPNSQDVGQRPRVPKIALDDKPPLEAPPLVEEPQSAPIPQEADLLAPIAEQSTAAGLVPAASHAVELPLQQRIWNAFVNAMKAFVDFIITHLFCMPRAIAAPPQQAQSTAPPAAPAVLANDAAAPSQPIA